MTEATSTIEPRGAALLVMDYQNGIVNRLEDEQSLLRHASEAIALARERGLRVGYVRVGFTDADYEAMPATSSMAAAMAGVGREAMHADSPNTAVHDRVAPRDGEIVVRKTRVGAFSTTDLDKRLRAQDVTTLILAGIATSGVVLSTVRDAADRDYRIIVLADACADFDPDVHEVLTTRVFPRQAVVATVADLEGMLGD